MIGLMRSKNQNRGFWLGLPWQGQGLMSGACDAVTDYWFDVLKFAALRVPKVVDDLASRKFSVRQGMRVVYPEEHEFVSGPEAGGALGNHLRAVAWSAPASSVSRNPISAMPCP